ncbi:exodeoxyribonuclease VII small subunit [Haloplanus pelagicus]|uniref:exodeoxyribonuclease VII small subunit n=1 Tax=Haloplanus pelagicus TaxID=2949995 RepID=UPI00203EA568|nr:exodeoxyribonuclease VII small subunit [Haloplanus sp. HW8-1]
MAKDPEINRRVDQVEEIIDQLDTDDVSLEKGKELHKEGEALLNEIREQLNEDEGTILEIE